MAQKAEGTQPVEIRGRLLRWSLVAYSVLVLVLSLYPDPRELIPPQWNLTDPALHFAGYLPLGVLLALALPLSARGSLGRLILTALAAIAVGALYGAALEIGQAFVGRTADVRDAAVNVAGLSVGVVAVSAARLIRRT